MKARESRLGWFDRVQIGVVNEQVRKINLIQVERKKKGKEMPKIKLVQVIKKNGM